ncbi:hypothetical protein [Polluticoccus soli]
METVTVPTAEIEREVPQAKVKKRGKNIWDNIKEKLVDLFEEEPDQEIK